MQNWIRLFCITLQSGSVLFAWYWSGSGCSREQSDLELYFAGIFLMILATTFSCPDILYFCCTFLTKKNL